MNSEKELVETKKANVKLWLKDPYNLTFLGIFLLAIIIRIYYFSLTSSQPLWWDESVYMAYAKNLAGLNVNFVAGGSQLSFFSYLGALLIKLGFSEPGLKFILELLPSILTVFLTYKICVLMYNDKRIALISSFLMATLWEVLFNSMRLQVEALSLFFGFLAIYVFWKGYGRKEKILSFIQPKWTIPLTVILVLLTFSIRKGYFMFGLFFLVYMILTIKPKDLIKDKYNWFALGIFLLLFFFLQKFILFSTESITSQYYHPEVPLNLAPLQVFGAFFKNIFNSTLSPLFYLFWIGIIILIFNLIFFIGYIRTKPEAKADLFVLLMLIITLSYFFFIQRATAFGEPRWYFPLLLASFICISKATLTIADYIRKYNKIIAVIVIILLIGYGGYYEVRHSDMIIKNKLDTYKGVKDSALFVKSISQETDILISKSVPQTAYYSERKVISPGSLNRNLSDFLDQLQRDKNIRFLIVSFWEPGHPEFMIKDFYTTNTQGQAMLVKWEIPFMDTTIDFTTGQQNIQQEKIYGKIKFKLLNILDRAFIYEITHE